MARESLTFYYDAECAMCVAFVRRLRWLDRRGRIAWRPSQSLGEPPQGLGWHDLARSAYLECGPGEMLEGFFAVRRALLAIPALWLLGALMHVPGASVVGVPAYRFVADRRGRSPGCSRGG